jgi:hypothetical protein
MKREQSTEVIIIGTLHGAHNQNPRYSEDALREILLALKPDAILVEMYSRHFNEDGSLNMEMIYLEHCPDVRAPHDAASALGIRQIPFDRERRDEYYAETKYFEKEQAAEESLRKWLDELPKDSFDRKVGMIYPLSQDECQIPLMLGAPPELINSKAFDTLIRIKHLSNYDLMASMLERYPGYEEAASFLRWHDEQWDERNGIMAQNVVRIAADFPDGRLAVTTGCEHRYILRELLADKPGIVLKEYWEVLHEAG